MTDEFYVYRPLLDLIGHTEGTDKGDGYNETLAYGALTGGDVDLVGMTLAEVDALQTKMLRHPKNKWKSSACGRYQIVRTTLRTIKQTLDLPDTMLFDDKAQDRMACYLLGVRGIDKYLAGRLSEDTLIDNLAKEWASLPTVSGKGYYGGQHAAVTPSRVREVLAEVRKRHTEGQPKIEKPVPVPTVPEKVVKEAEKSRNWGTWLTGLGSTLVGIAAWVRDSDADTLLIVGGFGVGITLVVLLGGEWIVRRMKAIKQEIEA